MEIELKKLYPVLIGIHLVALPLYPEIHTLILFILFALTAWVTLIISQRTRQPSALVRILTLIFSVFFLIIANGTIFGQQAGTSLLLLLALMKIFEVKNKRDINLIVFMSFFLIASNFFFSQSPLIAIYVFGVVIYLTSILIYLSDTVGTINFGLRLKTAGRTVAIAIPFMLILFVVFPRIPSPLWGLPKDMHTAKTGLAEELTLEGISQLVSSGEVAFRVNFDDEPPPHNLLYWRGPVLSHYDGKTWKRNDAPISAIANLIEPEAGRSFTYTMTLEPHDKNWLLSLEHPTSLTSNLRLSRELQLISKKPITNVMSYTATSTSNVINAGLFEQEAIRNLLLPKNINPESHKLASQFKQRANGQAEDIVHLALDYFRHQEFFYTLSPPPLSHHSMDDFLFATKRGFCGHYASAFVTLMRGAGIPSRVVTGYQGGVINPIDNYMIVRQSDAHAWAEVWLNDKGWVRVDPTAAVSPSRIESGIVNADLESNKLPALLLTDNAFLTRSRYVIDSMQNSWNKWIIGYNQQRQEQLFNTMGFEKIDASQLALLLVFAMTFSGTVLAGFMLRRDSNKNLDKPLYYYNVFCNKLKSAGLDRYRHEGEQEFLNKIKQTFPASARAAEIITNSYQQIRYNELQNKHYQQNFIRAVKDFRIIKS